MSQDFQKRLGEETASKGKHRTTVDTENTAIKSGKSGKRSDGTPMQGGSARPSGGLKNNALL